MTEPITPHLTPEQINALQLGSGSHKPGDPDPCLLEAESIFAGEPFGDSPSCVDPVLAAFGRSWNDALPDADRQQLKRYIGKMAGTNRGPALRAKRAFMALDWLWRVHAPIWFAEVPELAEHAAALRAIAPITAEFGEAERTAAIALVDKAARAARAAWDARVAWDARAARAARAAWDAWAAWDARDARAAWDARAARAAWDAWDAWDARAARDAWDAREAWDAWDARDAWDATSNAALTAAFEAAKGFATYEQARAKADAVFEKHRAAWREQLHVLFTDMINAELSEMGAEGEE